MAHRSAEANGGETGDAHDNRLESSLVTPRWPWPLSRSRFRCISYGSLATGPVTLDRSIPELDRSVRCRESSDGPVWTPIMRTQTGEQPIMEHAKRRDRHPWSRNHDPKGIISCIRAVVNAEANIKNNNRRIAEEKNCLTGEDKRDYVIPQIGTRRLMVPLGGVNVGIRRLEKGKRRIRK